MTDRATETLINWYGDSMAYEQRDGQGSLFKNKKKEKDSHPNATGSCKIGGVEYDIAAWTKQDKNGNPWQSLSFKPKGQQPQGQRPSATQDDDDGPPF